MLGPNALTLSTGADYTQSQSVEEDRDGPKQ